MLVDEHRRVLELEMPDLASRLSDIESYVRVLWRNVKMPWFTDHGPEQSRRTAEFALRLAATADHPSVALTPIETFALVAAADLHDIGLQDFEYIGQDRPAFSTAQYARVRHEHPERSFARIFDLKDDLGMADSPELLSAMAFIARAR